MNASPALSASGSPLISTSVSARVEPVFLFPGQGSQYPDMLRGLHASQPQFQAEMDALLRLFAQLDGCSLASLHASLFPVAAEREAAALTLSQTRYAQPLLYIAELSLARLWLSIGVAPAALFGHSIGEYAAAALAGVFSREDGLRLVAARGRLMQSLPAGGMLAVDIPASRIDEYLGDGICLAGDNSPGQSVLSGPLPALKRLAGDLGKKCVITHQLATSHAFHSSMMDPILGEFRAVVAQVSLQAPRIPMVSCRTGTWLLDSEATNPDYWVGQLREAVRFRQGIETLLQGRPRVLLEVGPGKALSTLAKKIVSTACGSPAPTILSSARRDSEKFDDSLVFHTTLEALSSAGLALRPSAWEQARAGTLSAWCPRALSPAASRTLLTGACIVFGPQGGPARAFAEHLRLAGFSAIAVCFGADLRRVDALECIVPRQAAALAGMVNKARQGGRLGRLVYCVVQGDTEDLANSSCVQDLQLLIQALDADQTSLELLLVSSGAATLSLAPLADSPLALVSQSSLAEVLQTVPRPWLRTRFLDLDPSELAAGPSQVLEELSAPQSDSCVAYRRGRRWCLAD